MNSNALVTSDDLILRGEARSILNEMNIGCTCSGTVGFDRAVSSSKFEAILLDLPNTDATLAAIRSVRTGKVNRYSIILSFVVDGQSASCLWAAGANFTIRRSATIANDLKKAFQSAHGLMLREKRRYYRHPVTVDAELVCNGRRIIAKVVDVSERGACIDCTNPIPKQPLQIQFVLPGIAQNLDLEAVPAWTRGTKTGIQFTSVDEASQTALSQWLINQLNSKVVKG